MPVEFQGVDNLRKALKSYAPDLDKALKKELAALAKPIVNKARGYAPAVAPLSNWGREGGKKNQLLHRYTVLRNLKQFREMSSVDYQMWFWGFNTLDF